VAGARSKPLLALAGCLAVLAAAAAAALPPSAFAAGCPGANLTPKQGNIAQVDAAVLCLVNAERERRGESALVPNASLAEAAEGHSADMAGRDYFSHVSPGGSTPLDRISASGYIPDPGAGYAVGENIAWGTLWLATPQAIVAAWMASPEHRVNILDPSYRETGVGVAPRAPASLAEGQAGAVYTQDFGRVVVARRSSRGAAAGAPSGGKGRSSGASGPASGKGRSPHGSARHAGQITSAPQTSEQRSKTQNGSSRRKVRHRHRIRARHRARHRRAARRTRRARAHQRSRRRHRKAGR
jgi:uncharacterized protein YkwD